MAQLRGVDSDDIGPEEIEHKCEEMFDSDKSVQVYNYIVYHFVRNGRYFWARTYLHEIDAVSVYGPFDGRETRRPLSGPPDDAMLSYLKRRFKTIKALGSEGYVVIWSR